MQPLQRIDGRLVGGYGEDSDEVDIAACGVEIADSERAGEVEADEIVPKNGSDVVHELAQEGVDRGIRGRKRGRAAHRVTPVTMGAFVAAGMNAAYEHAFFVKVRLNCALPGCIHDAETVAFRIGEDHVVGFRRALAPVHLSGAQRDQALNLSSLVVGIQIKMYAGRHMEFGADPVEGQVGSNAVAGAEQDKIVALLLARRVIERRRPERRLALQVVHTQND